ncbi:unnamed protein product, partial [Pelagomonas calceolata]
VRLPSGSDEYTNLTKGRTTTRYGRLFSKASTAFNEGSSWLYVPATTKGAPACGAASTRGSHNRAQSATLATAAAPAATCALTSSLSSAGTSADRLAPSAAPKMPHLRVHAAAASADAWGTSSGGGVTTPGLFKATAGGFAFSAARPSLRMAARRFWQGRLSALEQPRSSKSLLRPRMAITSSRALLPKSLSIPVFGTRAVSH